MTKETFLCFGVQFTTDPHIKCYIPSYYVVYKHCYSICQWHHLINVGFINKVVSLSLHLGQISVVNTTSYKIRLFNLKCVQYENIIYWIRHLTRLHQRSDSLIYKGIAFYPVRYLMLNQIVKHLFQLDITNFKTHLI